MATRDAGGRFLPAGGYGEAVDIEVDWETLRDRLKQGTQLLYVNMRNALSLAALIHEKQVRAYHRAPPPSASGDLIPKKSLGGPLSTVTRGLLGPLSTGHEVHGVNLDTLEMTRYIGRGIPYARIHEYGGVIRPRNAKVLTIPTIHHRTQAGDSRGRAIHFEGYWRRTKSGALFFFSKDTNLPLFLGVTRVTITPRLRFREFWKEGTARRTALFARAVGAAFNLERYPPART